MSLLLPLLSSFFAFLLGVFFVKYLTIHPMKMGVYLFLSSLSLYSIIVILFNIIEVTTFLITCFVSLFCFIVGYLLMAKIVLNPEDTKKILALTRKINEPGLEHIYISKTSKI